MYSIMCWGRSGGQTQVWKKTEICVRARLMMGGREDNFMTVSFFFLFNNTCLLFFFIPFSPDLHTVRELGQFDWELKEKEKEKARR
jgi:hypothetical protein